VNFKLSPKAVAAIERIFPPKRDVVAEEAARVLDVVDKALAKLDGAERQSLADALVKGVCERSGIVIVAARLKRGRRRG
jgi:hypothetical protein